MQAGKTVVKAGITDSYYSQNGRIQLIQKRDHARQHISGNIYREKYVKWVSCQIYERESNYIFFKSFGIPGTQERHKCEKQKERKAQ